MCKVQRNALAKILGAAKISLGNYRLRLMNTMETNTEGFELASTLYETSSIPNRAAPPRPLQQSIVA